MPDNRPVDGVSLLPALEGNPSQQGKPIGSESRNQLALSADRYKLVGGTDRNRFELYDLISDPGEFNDLASEHKDIVQQMKQTLAAWRESCKRSESGADYSK